MIESQEKIIAKIKKVLELSKNNPSSEEAKAAALKAQKLMADYHVTMIDLGADETSEKIAEEKISLGTGNKWKYALSNIIAKNFRCKCFFYGKESVVFYGYEVDAKIAAETFRFLFETGNKAATSYYNKLRNEAVKAGRYFDGTGIKNSFLSGYIDGIREVLERQCTALMIVIPKQVEEAYLDRSKGFRTSKHSLRTGGRYGTGAKEAGREAGKNAIGSRRLEMA